MIEKCHNKVLQHSNNNIVKSLIGNKNNNKRLKIMQINKGNSDFINSMEGIQNIISEHSPHIICMSEANIKLKKQTNVDYFKGYTIITNLQYNRIGISRNCIIIRDEIKYSRRLDLENDTTCEIWLQIDTGSNKHILLCGHYRQWTLLKQMGVKRSNTIKNQELRYEQTIKNWDKALKENRDTIFVTDDNIDSNIESSINKQYKLNNISNMLSNHMTKHNLTQHNFANTRHTPNQVPSCIDHIYSNVPSKISDTTTHTNITSDHSIITTIYNNNKQIYTPKFIKIRNTKLLTKGSLSLLFD